MFPQPHARSCSNTCSTFDDKVSAEYENRYLLLGYLPVSPWPLSYLVGKKQLNLQSHRQSVDQTVCSTVSQLLLIGSRFPSSQASIEYIKAHKRLSRMQAEPGAGQWSRHRRVLTRTHLYTTEDGTMSPQCAVAVQIQLSFLFCFWV